MAKKKNLPEVALCFNEDDDYFMGELTHNVYISVLRNAGTPESPKWRNCSTVFIGEENYPQYADLQVRTHCRPGDTQLLPASFSYWKPLEIELRTSRIMAKTLSLISKRMQKMSHDEGYPATFGEQVTRFARAIGARRIIFWHGTESNYDKDTWHNEWIENMALAINRHGNEWLNKQKESAA
jgi:hypothetical protein